MSENGTMPTVSPDKIQEHLIRNAASLRANATPLPGPLREAFGPDFIEVHGYQVRKVVGYDTALWQQINSPVHRMMLDAMQNGEKAKGVDPSLVEMFEICWQLTTPPREVRDVFNGGGIAAINSAAEEKFAFEQEGLVFALMKACFQQIGNNQKTILKYVSADEGGGETKHFRDTGASPATASDGS